MGHVASAVGGADTQEKYGTGRRFFPLARERQREAVRFLNEQAFATPEMLLEPDVLRRVEAEGAVDRIRDAQARVLATVFSASRLNRLIEYAALAEPGYTPYTLADVARDVRSGVWGELEDATVRIDVYRRNLQRSYLDVVESRLQPPSDEGGGGGPFGGGPPPVDPDRTDIGAVLRGELREIGRQVDSAASRSADAMTRLHLEDVKAKIDRILDPEG